MSWLSSFLHPAKGYEKGQEQLDKYFQQAQGQLQPYNQQGLQQYGNLNSYIQSLMNPEALQGQWASGYEESPQAKQAQMMAQTHGLDAASSLGLMGSSPALGAIQAGTTQIGLDERQNYLNNLMQKYLAGADIAKTIYGTGANTASQLGQNAMTMGSNSADMAFGKENSGGNMLSGLIGQGVGLVGSALGGSKRWNLSGGN